MSIEAKCPNCGAPITFNVGSSRGTVCPNCRSLVARRDQDFEVVGKVADLIPTGSRLALGLTGKHQGTRFRLVGRLQYQWDQGAWDEWYASFDDGAWGWLAEAQGRYYLSFYEPPVELPPLTEIRPGAQLSINAQTFTVTDLKRATIASAEGELPEAVRPGAATATADFEGKANAFGTIEFGLHGEAPTIFVGRQVKLDALGLEEAERPEASAAPSFPRAGNRLACPNCNGPIELRAGELTVRVACEYCGALLDTSKGALRLLAVLQKAQREPPIPLGAKGKLRGHDVQVVGWMRRSCIVDDVRYPWDELLLYEPATTGFLWLVLSDGHWQLVEPISAGEVSTTRLSATYRDQRYRLFSAVTGKVEEVLGEFYWAVARYDEAQLRDYIAPPHGLSSEETADEVVWSFASHVEAKELADAFGQPRLLNRPKSGVGAIQPWPFQAAMPWFSRWMFGGLAVALLMLIAFIARPTQPLLTHQFTIPEITALPDGGVVPHPTTYSYLSEPFTLGKHQAIEMGFTANVDNSWAGAAGALVPTAGGDAQLFTLEASYYHGYEGGESWSEGSRSASTTLPAQQPGEYVLRADLEWDPKLPSPPAMQLQLIQGGWSGLQFLVVMLLLSPPLLLLLFRSGFETSRWQNSNVGTG